MNWRDAVDRLLENAKPISVDASVKRRCMGLLDLTSLNDNDSEREIALLCEKANTPLGHVAGVCVYPAFIRLVADQFRDSPIKAVTVANFPGGDQSLEKVLASISRSLLDGAAEIDVVLPYQAYLAASDTGLISTFVETCKAAVGNRILKVIIETGALGSVDVIAEVAKTAWLSGADFVKTSTGKIATGATLEAVATLLLVLQSLQPTLKNAAGIKVSGGVKTVEKAMQYLSLAENVMGHDRVKSSNFRIGASQLRELLLNDLQDLD